MNAIISARSGIALLIDGESLTSFEVDTPDEITAREPEEYQRLLAGADDVEFHTDVDQAFVQQELVRRGPAHCRWPVPSLRASGCSHLGQRHGSA